jgi:hypothetical protein
MSGGLFVTWVIGTVRLASLLACLVVVASFTLFVTHQADGATTRQDALLGNATAQAASQTVVKPSAARQDITDASNSLTSPFHNVLGSDSAWTLNISQLVIALLVYGVGVGFALRWLRMRHE